MKGTSNSNFFLTFYLQNLQKYYIAHIWKFRIHFSTGHILLQGPPPKKNKSVSSSSSKNYYAQCIFFSFYQEKNKNVQSFYQ